jgi:5-methylcytosine-specific restriction protein A
MGKLHLTTSYRKIRAWKLTQFPLCELCLMTGRATPAVEVHHLLAVEDYPEEVENIMYLQSLCAQCHSEVRAKEGEGGRR